jgi:hypothetical protein
MLERERGPGPRATISVLSSENQPGLERMRKGFSPGRDI